MLSLQWKILKKKALESVIPSEFLEAPQVHAEAPWDVESLELLEVFDNGLETLSWQKIQEAQTQILNELHFWRAESQYYLVIDLLAIGQVQLHQALQHCQAHSQRLIREILPVSNAEVLHCVLWALADLGKWRIRYEVILGVNGLGLDLECLE